MELTQLFYFKTVAENNNMSVAAEKLHVSQPALSVAIKKLENELGTTLFKRNKNKIFLNSAGKTALTYAEEILGKVEEMKKALEASSGISLGFCDPGPMRFFMPLIQKAYPDKEIAFEVFEETQNPSDLLLSRKYSAIVTLNKLNHPDMISIPFAKESLLLSVPKNHIWAKRESVCLHDENNFEMVVYCSSGAYIRSLSPFLEWLKKEHNVQIYDDYFVFRQILAQKEFLTLTTRLVHTYRNDGEDRVVIPLTDSGIEGRYYISSLRTRFKELSFIHKVCKV